MQLEEARELATAEANKIGYQILVVKDPIANAEDPSGPYGYYPTMALPTFINSMRRGGEIAEVIEPSKSKRDRRKDIEDALIHLFRTNPAAIRR